MGMMEVKHNGSSSTSTLIHDKDITGSQRYYRIAKVLQDRKDITGSQRYYRIAKILQDRKTGQGTR